MPDVSVTIRQSTFERLQKHASPLVDSTDSVICKALDALDQISALPVPAGSRHDSASALLRDPDNLPALTHTKVLDAVIDGERIPKPNWNVLVEEILERIVKNVGLDRARQLCPVNVVKGNKTDEGYRYLPNVDVSVQGQDANSAGRTIVVGAKALNIAVDIKFVWRPKKGAAYPGEGGIIHLDGPKSGKTKRSPSAQRTPAL